MSSPSSDSARMEVVQCERDIQSIKAALRQVSSADSNQPNSLKVILTKIERSSSSSSDNNLNTDDVEVSLQLSAPVEEATIHKIHDESEGGEEEEGGSSAFFEGVETSMATLTVTLKTKEGGKILGTSEAYDMSSVCSLGGDAMKPKDEYVTELPIAIVASPGEEAAFIKDEAEGKEEVEEKEKATEEEGDKKDEEEEGDKKKEGEETTKATEEKDDETKKEEASTTSVVKPMATVTFKMVFKPSAKDQKEELYELLNKASTRRSQALERHRGSPTTTTASASTTTMTSSAAKVVKPGFLNKKSPSKKGKEPEKKNKLMQFYDKYLGPQSLTRMIAPIAKNYVIFFGAVILFHFKGQELALPAPV